MDQWVNLSSKENEGDFQGMTEWKEHTILQRRGKGEMKTIRSRERKKQRQRTPEFPMAFYLLVQLPRSLATFPILSVVT